MGNLVIIPTKFNQLTQRSNMNREIKFRGKSKDNGKWLYGNLQVPGKPGVEYFMWDEELCQRAVNPETIGQYTGLKDCNGKEIYEGDIVTISNNLKAVIIWFNGSFRFKDELSCKVTYFDDIGVIMRDYDVCVVGNIFDNPEMMKGGSNEA